MIPISWGTNSDGFHAETLRYSGLNHISTFWIQHGGSAYVFGHSYAATWSLLSYYHRRTVNCVVLHDGATTWGASRCIG